MTAQPPEGKAITLRFSPEIAAGLDQAKRRWGVGPVDYIRIAVARALVEDGMIQETEDDDLEK